MTAGEIASRFQMSKPAISKHLQVLENAGLVTSDKRGQFVWYSLAREELAMVIAQFMQTVSPVAEAPPRGRTSHLGKPRSPGRLDRLPPRA
jgi:DNA-binding transcriptional ArsR family regulator